MVQNRKVQSIVSEVHSGPAGGGVTVSTRCLHVLTSHAEQKLETFSRSLVFGSFSDGKKFLNFNKTMSSVQSMRRFVCDRLTAAAQEILGAFETKVENYEAEIARQRRLLDTILTPELKLHRTG